MNFFTLLDIRAFVARRSRVRMTNCQWQELQGELGRRTGGKREAGAFLLSAAETKPSTIRRIVYFDDLDPNCLTGGISMGSSAFGKLWSLCRGEGLRAIADVHTHPGVVVNQSDLDRANPMVAVAGHIAIIVPNLSIEPFGPGDCGVHVYLGSHEWDSHYGHAARRLLYVGRWA
jgi:proteasome lid subunit RPN8/RPN11